MNGFLLHIFTTLLSGFVPDFSLLCCLVEIRLFSAKIMHAAMVESS